VLPAFLASCGREGSPQAHSPLITSLKGGVETEPIESSRVVAGQTIYVPAYSSVPIADKADSFHLAVTLSIRNTDRAHPIVLATVGYYDQNGQLIRNYVRKPLRIAPLAAASVFIKESDTSGGISASFLVEWVSDQKVSAPVVESLMVGTASTQGISLRCPGRILMDRAQTSPGADDPESGR
jgi:hypothetical protein